MAPSPPPDDTPPPGGELPFPTSLCHRCAAPPRYIRSVRGSVFIMCPLVPNKYPPQPVRACALFRPRGHGEGSGGGERG
jgi:hypothetical protein